MTNEEIMALTLEEIEARKAEIKSIVEDETSDADFDALNLEVDALEERKTALVEEQRKADIEAVIDGAGENIETIMPEERHMATLKEIRSSAEYIDAYAKYIKNEDDREVRALLTDLVQDGQVPVPTFIEDEIKTAWEKSDLLSLTKKTYLKGNVKVGFELSATGASIHVEGAKEPSEEEITIGVVEITPQSIKKWITISDEVYDLKGEAFLRYIYDEITYRIAKKAEEVIIGLIEDAPDTATSSAVSVATVEADVITLGTVAEAISKLSDQATDPVIVMNKSTWAAFKTVQYAGSYAVDPFEGLKVLFNNDITAYADAEAGDTYAIVGDFSGIQANFPNGDNITIKFDDLSLAEKDLIKIVGREYVGLGIVADKHFVKIAKEAES